MKEIRVSGVMFTLAVVLLSVSMFFPAGMAFAQKEASPQEDVAKHPSCPLCGMDRAKFDYSRVYVKYDDGSTYGTCSLHCAALDMALNIDKAPESIQVGDYGSRGLIDAEQAFWVLGGDKMGVMTARAKWAFEKKEDADAFIKAHGGEPATFDGAMKATFEDMYEDTKMIRKKRQMMKTKQ